MRIVNVIVLACLMSGVIWPTDPQNYTNNNEIPTQQEDTWYHKTGRVLFGAASGAASSIVPAICGYALTVAPIGIDWLRSAAQEASISEDYGLMYYLLYQASKVFHSVGKEHSHTNAHIFPTVASTALAHATTFISTRMCKNDKYAQVPRVIMNMICNLGLWGYSNILINPKNLYFLVCDPMLDPFSKEYKVAHNMLSHTHTSLDVIHTGIASTLLTEVASAQYNT